MMLLESRWGPISMASAGQVMLSTPGTEMRPRVTLKPACVSAELTAPARAMLRVIHGAWAVFHARKRVGCAGARDEAKSSTPEPFELVWRLRQTAALAWLATSARRSRSMDASD